MSVPGGPPPPGGGGWGPPQGGVPAPAYGAPPPSSYGRPGPPPGDPGWAPQPPQVGPPGGPNEPKGTWIGVILAVLFLVGSMLSCAVTGLVAATESERVAVEVSYVTVPLIVAGLFPWIVALLLRKKGTALAIGAPIGCGCLTWLVSLVGLIVFYVAIWPSL